MKLAMIAGYGQVLGLKMWHARYALTTCSHMNERTS